MVMTGCQENKSCSKVLALLTALAWLVPQWLGVLTGSSDGQMYLVPSDDQIY